MQGLNSWLSTDMRVMALFSDPVLETFAAHRQLKPSDCEAGGILLGRRRGRHFEITDATNPFPLDSRARTSFVREPAGHQEVATHRWSSSRSEIGYLGEWHTHPEAHPKPSSIDTSQWHRSSLDVPAALPFMAVIVGMQTCYVAIWSGGRLQRLLAPVNT